MVTGMEMETLSAPNPDEDFWICDLSHIISRNCDQTWDRVVRGFEKMLFSW